MKSRRLIGFKQWCDIVERADYSPTARCLLLESAKIEKLFSVLKASGVGYGS